MATNKAWAGAMILGTCVTAQMGGALPAVLIAAAGALCVKKLLISWHTDTTDAIYQDRERRVWRTLDAIKDERVRRTKERDVRKDIAALRDEQRKHQKELPKLAGAFAWGVFAFPFVLVAGAGCAIISVLREQSHNRRENKQRNAAT